MPAPYKRKESITWILPPLGKQNSVNMPRRSGNDGVPPLPIRNISRKLNTVLPRNRRKLASLGTLRHLSPTEHTVQEKVAELQGFITEHYYTCTNEILGSLGQMYLADRRMRDNIDRAGGDGTAEFASRAIAAYVK